MRKCRFKERVLCERTEAELYDMYDKLPDGKGYKSSRGTGFEGFKKNNLKYYTELIFYGYFHQFGTDIVEDDAAGNVQFTTAIIEDTSGKLHNVNVEDIKFLPDDFNTEIYSNHELIFGW